MAGRFIIADDEDGENEGDLTIDVEKIATQSIDFMTVHVRGLICSPISRAIGVCILAS